ncbi:MAG: phosphoenolpyruvate--protein phosphotransferase [Candidatus Omnitrophota bacterium]
MIKLKGIAAASGIRIGPAYRIGKEEFVVPKVSIREEDIPVQIQFFEEALIKTRREIIELQKKIGSEMGQDEAQIFDAHLLVLEDRMLIEEVISRLKKEKVGVAFIFSEVLKKYIDVFSKIEDEYLKERTADINDVGKRILRHLLGKTRTSLSDLKEKAILVAHDLSPSDTAAMHKQNVAAFVTDIGGKTSHTAIMAKSLEIPAVVGVEGVTAKIKTGDLLIVDGNAGLVIIDPDEETLRTYRQEGERLEGVAQAFLSAKDLPAVTLDGREVEINANIEFPDEVHSVKLHGAQGIGLYRTEFFYMNRKDLPSEEEHYQAYKYVAEEMNPYPVIIRTIDLGGDKFLSQFQTPSEMQPFLGWRAIRFCLARPDIFKVQLRGVLRASVHGNLKLMYPMISGIEELEQANKILEEAKQELRNKGAAFNNDIQVGAMIEVPSAAMTADILAREANFFSIGTNDLIQYSLAVDRVNEKVAYLYEPAHPAVLRLIKSIIDAAHKAGIKVGMCGEMAGEPSFALMLLGLGLDEFSMPPQVIPEIKFLIRSVTLKQAQEFAGHVLGLSTASEFEEFSRSRLKDILE